MKKCIISEFNLFITPESRRVQKLDIYVCITTYYRVVISAGGLLVPVQYLVFPH